MTFHRFVVLASLFEAIPFEESEAGNVLPEILPDVDIEILVNSEQKDLYNIVLDVSGNMETEKKPGYSFSVSCEGIFSINKKKPITKESVDQLLLFSAVPMVISSLRGYLLNISSYSVYGQYNLPAIDLQDFIEKKMTSSESGQRANST